jgi:hypothetical protein
MFEEIHFYSMEIGKEYFISGIEIDIIYYRGIFDGYSFNCAKFHSIQVIYPSFMEYGERAFHYYPKRYYYKFVSKKKEIQQAMETRAMKKILAKITGDECFIWK